MDSMKSRIITAAVGIPLLLLLLVLGETFNLIQYFIISVLSLVTVFELLSAKKLHRDFKILIPCVLFALLQPPLTGVNLGFLPVCVFVFLLLFLMILNPETISYDDVTFSITGTLIIVLGLTSILALRDIYGGFFLFMFVLCVGTPWCADGGAYFGGVFFGRHKLIPKVSPNKTVEGFVGGIIAGTLCCPLIAWIFSLIYRELVIDFPMFFAAGFVVSVASVLGDLTFSMIKRSCKIKDYGSIFPGHGGFLDRFDSVIFSAPVIYLISTFFPLFR